MASSRNKLSSDAIQAAVRAALRRHVSPQARLAVGLSGGIDSVVLLHALACAREGSAFRLEAIHVHHGLSAHADAWAVHCESLCAKYRIPLRVERVNVAPTGQGVEAAARAERYRAYASLDADVIALAHHRDDQAETAMLNLLRGAGIAGAAAMRPTRPLGGSGSPALVIRPLLEISRDQIADYAQAHDLRWIDDDSNGDTGYSRNFLRHEIMPMIRARFPRADAALARFASFADEAQGLLDALAQRDLGGHPANAPLPVTLLAGHPQDRACNLLRFYLGANSCRAPDSALLRELLRQALSVDSDNHLCVNVDGHQVRCYRGALHVVPQRAPVDELDIALTLDASGPHTVELPHGVLRFESAHGAGMSAERARREPLRIKLRRGGERIRPALDRPRRGLKDAFHIAGVPPWERGCMPILWCGPEVAWVAGIGVDAAFQCGGDEDGWRVLWIPHAV